MNLLDTLSVIRQAGGRVWIESGAVRVKAPVGIITPEHNVVLDANKAILLNLLAPPVVDASIVTEPTEEELTWFECLPAAEQQRHVNRAAEQWDAIVATDQSAGQRRASPLIPIRTRVETVWCDGSQRYTIPASSP